MNTLAKRLYNLSPRPVRLTLDSGETIHFEPSSAEFFGEAFQAEGVSDDITHRLVTDGEDDPLLIAEERDDGWDVLGEVTAVEAAD
ncbi:hypothetical protein BRC86_07505 [Halobacteriales archaeon QS_3_64_16]|nr:MAG: hypothetical protein BRC86_07505 [Halobacteriales archaeon QS_3_64_16]